MAVHTSILAHFLCPPKYIMMHLDVLNIHFRLFPSLHSVLGLGKVDFWSNKYILNEERQKYFFGFGEVGNFRLTL
jgi:hypothetical protein